MVNDNDDDPSSDSESEEEEAEAPDLHLSVPDKIKMMLLLATKKRHKLTYSAAECIMKLAGVLSQTESFTPSKHLMKRTIKAYAAGLSEHHVCPKCSHYHGPAEEDFSCSKCGRRVSIIENKRARNCFLYLSIGEQLKFLLESGLLDKIISTKERQKIGLGSYEDIYDGKIYKDRVPSDEDCISFNFFVDGLQVSVSTSVAFVLTKTGVCKISMCLFCLTRLPLRARTRAGQFCFVLMNCL